MLDIMDMKLLHACYFVQWCTFSVLRVEQGTMSSEVAAGEQYQLVVNADGTAVVEGDRAAFVNLNGTCILPNSLSFE